jgi:hypothetical protein
LIKVLAAIKLDDETRINADEVDKVWTDSVLAAELEAE